MPPHMIQVFTERNFQLDFIWLKSKAVSTKFLHGFIFSDGKLGQTLGRLILTYYSKNSETWYLTVDV